MVFFLFFTLAHSVALTYIFCIITWQVFAISEFGKLTNASLQQQWRVVNTNYLAAFTLSNWQSSLGFRNASIDLLFLSHKFQPNEMQDILQICDAGSIYWKGSKPSHHHNRTLNLMVVAEIPKSEAITSWLPPGRRLQYRS